MTTGHENANATPASLTRVLLVCPEPLGHRHPAGVGIRFLEMASALLAEGHELTILSPDAGPVEGCIADTISPESIATASRKSDVAVLQGHIVNDFFAHAAPIPSVVDLYDPWIIENLHYHRSHGSKVFDHDRATLLRSIEGGDLFLCASNAQRLFYAGLFLATGRITPESFENDPELQNLIRVVPFGVPPPRAHLPEGSGNHVLFGGIYDWYDPIAAIEAVVVARSTIPDMTLTFNMHPNPELTPQGQAAAALEFVRSNRYDDFIRFEPWVPYRDREMFYDRFLMALVTFPPSLETDLAMRTRIFDYLWGGLPVVSSPAPGTDETLRTYDAGMVIQSGKPADFAAAVVEIASNRSLGKRMQSGTQSWAIDHQWRSLLAPLLDFCRNPVKAARGRDEKTFGESKTSQASMIDRIRTRLGGRS